VPLRRLKFLLLGVFCLTGMVGCLARCSHWFQSSNSTQTNGNPTVPSENVGGDLVDVVSQDDGSLLAYLADFSGHALPAGILMGRFKTAVRTSGPDNPNASSLLSPINNVLPQVKEPEMYATCAAARIRAHFENSCKYFEYALAGHPAPAIFSSSARQSTRGGLGISDYVEAAPTDLLSCSSRA